LPNFSLIKSALGIRKIDQNPPKPTKFQVGAKFQVVAEVAAAEVAAVAAAAAAVAVAAEIVAAPLPIVGGEEPRSKRARREYDRNHVPDTVFDRWN
jgi:3-mercaptopyruvate sulfurtransferase SseA